MNFEEGTIYITQTFSLMLYTAERMFGERDKEWTFIGIEFNENGPYVCYYPFKRISIVLSSGCSNMIPNSHQLCYQLAHEVCHLLYPTGHNDANVLNEGISTYFSRVYHEQMFPDSNYAISNIQRSRYYRAYLLVAKLLDLDPDAIKKIRNLNPNISHVTKEEMQSLEFGLTSEEIEELVSRF